MSAETRHIEVAVTVADHERWKPETRALAEADERSSLYADWAMSRLAEVMREAGQRFIDEHPDVFEGGSFL